MVFLVRDNLYPVRVFNCDILSSPQNSLFSSIVASFIIEIYKTLLPDRGQQTVGLLTQLVSQSSTPQPTSPANLDNQPFEPPPIAIRVNIVLFLSFFLSIMSAVACALIRQWCNEYMKNAYPRAAPHECGHVRTYLFQGLDQFQMRRVMYGTHVLLHISVFLFFWALSDFFYTVHNSVGAVSRYCLVVSLVVYLAFSISPLIFVNSPFITPLTHPLGAIRMRLLYFFRAILWHLLRWRDHSKRIPFPSFSEMRFDRARLILRSTKNRKADLERYAMKWLFTENDFSDRDMDKFLEGLPGYMSSRHTEQNNLDNIITKPILERIRRHLLTCATSSELSEEESIARVLCCVESPRLVLRRTIESDQYQYPSDPDNEDLNPEKTYVEDIICTLQSLCEREEKDPVIALRAPCVRGLAFHVLLTQITHSHANTTSDRPFPISLIPLYTLFFRDDSESAMQRLEERRISGEDGKRMWKILLSDGPLVNLTMLAEAIHLVENAPPESLSFCWTTLDMLVKQLGITRSEASDDTQRRFNYVHRRTRMCVREKDQGFHISPLLDALDTVARGRRLSMAFSGHPQYHSRADVVFGKEHLRNSDLLNAFARCLPDYIARLSPPEKRMKFMEDIVCNDDLWTSLQVNLWNAQRSDRPTPDKLRVFEDCCSVLDVVFSSLEGSAKVDWRVPEFGSLVQHLELFITHSLQGSFMGRATSFRIGVIRARCCKALLTQFFNDVQREGTLFFRSQWDVTSLARLFWTLGTGDANDAEFWKSYINGGHVGAEFTTKACEAMDQAILDGPLMIFYKLGRLATTAVPSHGSGLEDKDLEKVWELHKDMIQDQRLPLNRASDQVWERLRGLRAHVDHLCCKMSGDDGDRLQPLLEMIDDVLSLAPGPKELRSSEPAEGRGPVTASWPLRQQYDSFNLNRSSLDSGATAVNEGRSPTLDTGNKDNIGGASSWFVSGVSPLTWPSGHSVDRATDNQGAIPFGLASPYPARPNLAPVGSVDSILGAFPLSASPVYSYFSDIGDTGPSYASPHYPHLMRSASGLNLFRQSIATRLGSGIRQTSPISSPDPTTRYSPPGPSDAGQSGRSPSHNSEVSEDE